MDLALEAYRKSEISKQAQYESVLWNLVALLPYDYATISVTCQQFLSSRSSETDVSVTLNWLRSCIEDRLKNGYQNEATQQFISILREYVQREYIVPVVETMSNDQFFAYILHATPITKEIETTRN